MTTRADSFVHLHVHSEYSMLDGAARVKPLIAEAVSQGMPAIAITDHGSMFGAFDFWKTATESGIKPIIGIEAYLTPGTHRTDKTRVKWGVGGEDDVSGSGAYTHLTMLAASTTGMHNLFRMSSLASIEGYYFKPRMGSRAAEPVQRGRHRDDGLRERRSADAPATRGVRQGSRSRSRVP